MKAIFKMEASRDFRAGSLVLFCALLGGCFNEEHYTHRDLVSHGAGDAVAVNAATHTINPWPKEAKNPKVDVNGKRLTAAVRRYEDNRVIPPRGLNTTTVTQQAGPGAQENTAIQK